MAISKLSMSFIDGSTVIDANKMNAIVSKINELVDAANGSSSGGGSSDSGGSGSGGQQTPTNLFEIIRSDFSMGINTDGNLVRANKQLTSDYIPVTAGKKYTFSKRYAVAWYNSSKELVLRSSASDSNILTIECPSGAVFMRFSILYTDLASIKATSVNEGDTLIGDTSNNDNYPPSNIPNLFVTSTALEGQGLEQVSGEQLPSTSSSMSDYINVQAGRTYSFYTWKVAVWYDSSKNIISVQAAALMTPPSSRLVAPNNAACLRFSWDKTAFNTSEISVNEGELIAVVI